MEPLLRLRFYIYGQIFTVKGLQQCLTRVPLPHGGVILVLHKVLDVFANSEVNVSLEVARYIEDLRELRREQEVVLLPLKRNLVTPGRILNVAFISILLITFEYLGVRGSRPLVPSLS